MTLTVTPRFSTAIGGRHNGYDHSKYCIGQEQSKEADASLTEICVRVWYTICVECIFLESYLIRVISTKYRIYCQGMQCAISPDSILTNLSYNK